MTPIPLELVRAPELEVVGAVIVDQQGRYLLQLRDDRPGLPLRRHWALFGGGLDATETPDQALRRELIEELEFAPTETRWFHAAVYALPGLPHRIVRKSYFAIAASEAQLAAMVQHEGAGRRMFSLAELLRLDRIAPWDLSAILIHARAADLYR